MKELKRRARQRLKKHYLLFAAVCLVAAFLGTEFSGSLSALTAYTSEQRETGASDTVNGRSVTLHRDLTGLIEELAGQAQAAGQEHAPDKEENPILGTTRGVFAYLINAVSSGSFAVTAFTALNSLLHSESLALGLLVLAGFLGLFAVWFFLQNMYTAVSRRIFLEGRIYDKVPSQRLLFFLRVKRWCKVSCTMFVTSLFQALWSLTVVGGIIKRYSYFLVPYLTAENPDIGALEAITLSRRMMKGHKWQCFLYELTFLGWDLLGGLTLGLTAILYSNPYRVASFSEYYAVLRVQVIDGGIPGAQALNDRYLFETPERAVLAKAYADVLELMEKPEEHLEELRGVRGFLARNFGVLLAPTERELAYEKSQAEQVRIRVRKDAAQGRIYPERLFPLPETEKREQAETTHYLRCYSIWSLLLMFFMLSFVGWVWEVALHLVAEHELVNRGILHGPWLPIYGAGSLLILVLLNRFRKRPALEFISAVVLCGIVEYTTSYVMELMHNGQKWWDYSGYFLNLNGRICGEGLLVFGLGGMLVVYLLAPQLDNLIRRIPRKVLVPLCVALLVLFLSDQVYSSGHPNAGKGITEDHPAAAARVFPVQPHSAGNKEGRPWLQFI